MRHTFPLGESKKEVLDINDASNIWSRAFVLSDQAREQRRHLKPKRHCGVFGIFAARRPGLCHLASVEGDSGLQPLNYERQPVVSTSDPPEFEREEEGEL